MRDEILAKIKAASVDQVNLGHMNIVDDEISAIAKAIKKSFPDIEYVYLNNNNISDNGAIVLGSEFASLKKLSFLDLQFNAIDKKGVSAICALKSNHPQLTIALHGNKIHDVGVMKQIEDAAIRNRK